MKSINERVAEALGLVQVGQHWRENDNRFKRTVEILAVDPERQKAKIQSVGGHPYAHRPTTWASLSRFNGKSGGYSLAPTNKEER